MGLAGPAKNGSKPPGAVPENETPAVKIDGKPTMVSFDGDVVKHEQDDLASVENPIHEDFIKPVVLLDPRIDSTRAWGVALGLFFAGFATFGNSYAFGIFLPALMQEYGGTLAETSLVGTISLAMFFIGGLVSPLVAQRIGLRPMVIVGSIIWFAGCMLGSVTATLWQQVLTQGVLTGIGQAICLWPALAVVPSWFRRYRGSAMSLSVLGSGVGSIVFSLAGQDIMNSFGWRNTLRLIGGIGGVMLIFAVVLIKERVPSPNKNKRFIDILKSPSQIVGIRSVQLFMASIFLFQFAFFIPFTFLSSYSISLGFSSSFGAFAISMLGIGSTIGRFTFGPVADVFGHVITYKFLLASTVIMLAVWTICITETTILIFAFFYAFFAGGFAALFITTASSLWGVARLPAVMSLINLMNIPGAFASGPLFGFVKQETGSWVNAIWCITGLAIFSLLFFLPIMAPKTPPDSPVGAYSVPNKSFAQMQQQQPEQPQAFDVEAGLPKQSDSRNLVEEFFMSRSLGAWAPQYGPQTERLIAKYGAMSREEANAALLEMYGCNFDMVEPTEQSKRAAEFYRFRLEHPDRPYEHVLEALQHPKKSFQEVIDLVKSHFNGYIPKEWDAWERDLEAAMELDLDEETRNPVGVVAVV